MPNKPHSTHCRYCGEPGNLVKGAHLKCFNSKPSFDDSIPGAREAYNRKKGVQKLVRDRGMSREEAETYYDVRSKNCDCGNEKARNAKYCPACAKKQAAIRSAVYMEENREKIRRADNIRHRMKAGMTREEAEKVDDVKGICACGNRAKHPTGRICIACYQERDRVAHKGVRRLVSKLCANCGAAFQGTSNAKYCDVHKQGGNRRKPKPVVVPVTWERKGKPKPEPLSALPQPTPEMLSRVVRQEIHWSRWD